ncbi:MAG: ribosome biogenesis/translation initiation ATPase RLI [Candidatus Woesearchaeota archaeon]
MPKRIAIVDNTKLKDEDKKKYIQSLCPINRTGKECITIEGKKLLIDESLCIGCGICVNAAPEAIKIINLPSALEKQPIHRHSLNGFVLYNLPIPIFGKVVGIIGINGIGKSTAIKILADVLKPNLGEIGKEATIQDLINYFKGTEAQLYFEKVKKGLIKVAYKPQQVDLIAKQYSGKVIDLLKKVDSQNETSRLQEITNLFELDKLLDRDISVISGGELQRVAIAATFLKKANLYIFDEPTSYLDIKQRLKISKLIKNLASEKNQDNEIAVIVIEHDLIALDYMADIVHVMYGNTGSYGVVSQPKQTKNGINSFLEGYLREENVRFRETKLQFNIKNPFKSNTIQVIANWPYFEKSIGDFKLIANEGNIKYNEKIGILGVNGIGKTSFIKVLAGELKPDNWEKSFSEDNKKIKVSYKPQYLNSDSEELVMVLLQEAIQKYNVELIRPLDINPLFLKKINELSGGELQRVAIAYCLSKEADLYLLDEPSAYLDVEQRLIVSKVISNIVELRKVSVVVVDHDLLFLDYLSERLIVFQGEPAVRGESFGPYDMEKGMNTLLKDLEITLRRDEETKRPRINKEDSFKDREQKREGKYYYV